MKTQVVRKLYQLCERNAQNTSQTLTTPLEDPSIISMLQKEALGKGQWLFQGHLGGQEVRFERITSHPHMYD